MGLKIFHTFKDVGIKKIVYLNHFGGELKSMAGAEAPCGWFYQVCFICSYQLFSKEPPRHFIKLCIEYHGISAKCITFLQS